MDDQFQITLNTTVCRTLYQAVCDALEAWPGSPARPAEQQEQYRQLKLLLFSIICEANYELWTKTAATSNPGQKKQSKVLVNTPNLIMDVSSLEDKESKLLLDNLS